MKIRIISRPIAPPWDSGSMNMAYGVGICLSEIQHTVYMPVVQGFHPPAENVIAEPVYTKRIFGLGQKVRLMGHLLAAQPADVVHFFLGVTPVTAAVLSTVVKIRRTPAVLTLTHVPKQGRQPAAFGQRIVTYSVYLARLLQQSGFEGVVHIPPGVDEQIFHPCVDGDRAGRVLHIPSDVPVVLYGGECGRSATLETLLKALSICLSNHSRAYFVLACRTRSKYEQARMRELIQQLQNVPWGRNVIVRGQISDMRSLIARANVCILPLRHTYGKVDVPLFLLEAMAMAKPIVITDIAPLNELLEEPVGLAVPVGDEVALAQAIERMLVEGESYGARGRQLVERRYTLRQTTRRYERLYAELSGAADSRLL
jgi:glycosyltransferase involved in cell wall biosynthesis